jgi:hypothetical protein
MYRIAFLAIELLVGVVLALEITVIVLARIHFARMKKLDPHYSPLPEFELDNYYAQSDSLQAVADAQGSSSAWQRDKRYAHLSRAAGL